MSSGRGTTPPVDQPGCGPIDGEGNHDVLFNNKTGVFILPDIVEAIIRQITPIAQFPCEGGLYIADLLSRISPGSIRKHEPGAPGFQQICET